MDYKNENKTSSASQCAMIKQWLLDGNTITSLEALQRFGCMRLASRICDLREKGLDIATKKVQTESGKYVTEYSINNN